MIQIQRRGFLTFAKQDGETEFLSDFNPLTFSFDAINADVFTFWVRTWTGAKEEYLYPKILDNVALLEVKSHGEWWQHISRKTRNMVRKSEKHGCICQVLPFSDETYRQMVPIYNETEIRQQRRFSSYGISLAEVRRRFERWQHNSTIIGVSSNEHLVGFTHLIYNADFALVSSLLSLQSHFHQAPNNALISKAVEVCTEKNIHKLVYYKFTMRKGLNAFKQSNGFTKYDVPRYIIGLTDAGKRYEKNLQRTAQTRSTFKRPLMS